MSTNFISSIQYGASSTNTFRALGLFITNTWQAGGFIKTGDSGQIDWTTVTYPVGNDTVAGYEIRYFNDSLNGSFPVVCKLEYGTLNQPEGQGQLWLTVGMGSDGNGNITNIIYSRTAYRFANNGVGEIAVSGYGLVSAGNGYAGFLFLQTSSTISPWPFGIERARDSAGNITGNGILITYRVAQPQGSTGYGFVYVQYNTKLIYIPEFNGTNSYCGGTLPPWFQSSGLSPSNDITIYPNYYFDVGGTSFPGTLFVGAFTADYVKNMSRTVRIFGENHTYYGIDYNNLTHASWLDRQARAAFGAMMRWE